MRPLPHVGVRLDVGADDLVVDAVVGHGDADGERRSADEPWASDPDARC